ncbi:hypothetical protein HK405_015199, partial [Cladochytrium tenue]
MPPAPHAVTFGTCADPLGARHVVRVQWLDRPAQQVPDAATSAAAASNDGHDAAYRLRVTVLRLPLSLVGLAHVTDGQLQAAMHGAQDDDPARFEDTLRAAIDGRRDRRGRRAGCSIHGGDADTEGELRLSLFIRPDADNDIEFEVLSVPLKPVARSSQREVVWSELLGQLVDEYTSAQKTIATQQLTQTALARSLEDAHSAFDRLCRDREEAEVDLFTK